MKKHYGQRTFCFILGSGMDAKMVNIIYDEYNRFKRFRFLNNWNCLYIDGKAFGNLHIYSLHKIENGHRVYAKLSKDSLGHDFGLDIYWIDDSMYCTVYNNPSSSFKQKTKCNDIHDK